MLKIVSGGQTGVDQAALNVAIFLELPHGGWCPAGRRSEEGPIPDIYQLTEVPQKHYAARTEKNVLDSDGTLILFDGQISRGTLLTLKLAQKHHRPHLCVDLGDLEEESSIRPDEISDWLKSSNINVLNVAGPRESSSPGIATKTERFLVSALEKYDVNAGLD